MSDLFKGLLSKNSNLKGLPPRMPAHLKHSSDGSHSAPNKRDYSVLPWSNYFDKFEDITVKQNDESECKFRVYIKGDCGPVVFFLHGGGFSALSWSVLSSILVKEIECQCYAIDIRGHGDSHTNDDEDLSMETMTT
jgi:protein phosphatase methylesterase 1